MLSVLPTPSRDHIRYIYLQYAGYPLHRENRDKKNCQRKHREFGIFANTQGIWFAHVANSLILKVKDISLFAMKISKNVQNFFEAR